MIFKMDCPYCGNGFLRSVENGNEVNTKCPSCGGPMEITERISEKEIAHVPQPVPFTPFPWETVRPVIDIADTAYYSGNTYILTDTNLINGSMTYTLQG